MRIRYNDRLLAFVRPETREEVAARRGVLAITPRKGEDLCGVIWDHATHLGVVTENWKNLCEDRT